MNAEENDTKQGYFLTQVGVIEFDLDEEANPINARAIAYLIRDSDVNWGNAHYKIKESRENEEPRSQCFAIWNVHKPRWQEI